MLILPSKEPLAKYWFNQGDQKHLKTRRTVPHCRRKDLFQAIAQSPERIGELELFTRSGQYEVESSETTSVMTFVQANG
jgi:hypothetical protein